MLRMPKSAAATPAQAVAEGDLRPQAGAASRRVLDCALDLVADWRGFLSGEPSEDEHAAIRAGERTGRPLGSAKFVARLEKRLKRPLARQKLGPKPDKSAAPGVVMYCVPGIQIAAPAISGPTVFPYRLSRAAIGNFPGTAGADALASAVSPATDGGR
jgi:hypothetical protein